jgi:cyclopropane-fatty-acyl-phospholipid synthase
MKDTLQNNQSIQLSKKVGEQHYDIPDILYEYMLDSRRQYTCGYWKPDTKTLEEAQQNKINC